MCLRVCARAAGARETRLRANLVVKREQRVMHAKVFTMMVLLVADGGGRGSEGKG